MATVKLREPTTVENNKINNAANTGNLQTLQELTSSGVNITGIVSTISSTALHYAAFRGHNEVISYLIDHGARLDDVNKDQRTALHFAAMGGHTNSAVLLVDSGANVNMKDSGNRTPLEIAVDNSHSDTVYFFIHEVKMDVTKFPEETQVKINELMKKAEKKQSSSDRQAGSHDPLQGLNMPITASEALMKYNVDLLEHLPLENVVFFAMAQKAGLFPLDTGDMISEKHTRAEKVSYFLRFIGPGADSYLPELLKVMKDCGVADVVKLAEEIAAATGMEAKVPSKPGAKRTAPISAKSSGSSEAKRMKSTDSTNS